MIRAIACTAFTGVNPGRIPSRRMRIDNVQRGFTLIEMLLVATLVVVLLVVMLPAYQGQLISVRRSLAWAELLQVRAKQEQFFLNHGRYADELTDLGLPGSPYAIDSQGAPVEALAERRIYLVSLVTHQNRYTLMATPQREQAGDRFCGSLSIDSTGRKQSTGAGPLQQC